MKKIRLLIVDDDDDYMIILRDILNKSSLSFEIDEVNTAKLAMEKLKESKYECVVIDYLIPGMSGLEVMKLSRGLGIKTPFIIFSGFGDVELAEEIIKQGAADFISKDELSLDVLQYKINAVISEELSDETQSVEVQIKNQAIGKLMSSPPHSIDSEVMLEQVVKKLNSLSLGSVLVEKNGTFVGIVTKSDLIRKAIAEKLPQDSTKVSTVMASPIISMSSDTFAKEAYQFMNENHFRHLAVTESGLIVGVVSVKDLVEK